MFRKTKDILALDLGTHSIKMMQLGRGKKGWRLSSSRSSRYKMDQPSQENPPKLLTLGMARLAPETVVESHIEKPEELIETVQRLAEHLDVKGKGLPLALALTGYEVMIKRVSLPMMTEEELEARMNEELGQYVPYPVTEVNIDYEIMGMDREKSTHMDVMLVAAKREVVDEYVNVIQLAGFEPAVIDVDFFAISNAFEATYGVHTDKSIAVANIGATKTSLGILHEGVLGFTQDLPMGGSQFDEAIQRRFGAGSDEAERIKLGGAVAGMDTEQLRSVFLDVGRNWSANFQRAFEFYGKNFVDKPLDALYICGGCARISGLDHFLRQQLGMKVEIFNPVTRLIYDEDKFDSAYLESVGPQMVVCLGLGLRGANES